MEERITEDVIECCFYLLSALTILSVGGLSLYTAVKHNPYVCGKTIVYNLFVKLCSFLMYFSFVCFQIIPTGFLLFNGYFSES